MILGVVLATKWSAPGLPHAIILTALALLAAMAAWRGVAWRWQLVLVCLAWGLGGLAAAVWQLQRAPAPVESGATTSLAGTIEQLDGRYDSRLRIWLRVDEAQHAGPVLRGQLVRLSVRPDMLAPRVGSRISVLARIYPPPRRLLHGARDYALQARVRGVVASGYVTDILTVGRSADPPSLSLRLAAFRQDRADHIAGGMNGPAGGIAAALLIGDRRYVGEDVYDLFRQSGLAHLLAISGLHMGLLCFGVIGFLRRLAALVPSWACRLPVHKIAALGGVGAGLGYVLLSGLSVSAIRAFLMAVLILAALLMDRLGLTLRNVGLAAGAILLVNPAAVFGAGFQLSFAATTGLVIWFESWRHRAGLTSDGAGRPRLLRWAGDLVVASLVASAATTPLTAQHFGTVTPWGVLANLAGIPLTGIWIMPSGLLVLVTQVLPVPDAVAAAALGLMAFGIDLLIAVAAFFADLPASPVRVTPPGAPLLIVMAVAGLVVLCSRVPRMPAYALMAAMIAVAAFVMAARASIDGVLIGQGPLRLVVAGSQGDGTLYNSGAVRRRQLSSFHRDAVLRALAVHHIRPSADDGQQPFRQHRLASGLTATVVVSRRGLSAACREAGDLVLALVVADYPCRSGKPLVSLARLPADNFVLRIDSGVVTAVRPDGQYLRISPVSRP